MRPYIVAAVAIASIVGASATAAARQVQAPSTPIHTLVLTAQPTKAYGENATLANPVLQSGDQIHLYGEPGDFGWHAKDDVAKFNLVAAIEVRGRDGRITGKAAPRVLAHEAASRPANFFFSLSVKVEGSVGIYSLVVRLRDAVTGQAVERTFPFALANKRLVPRPPSDPVTTPAQVSKAATSGERARPLTCRQYFPQLGEMISVQCAPGE